MSLAYLLSDLSNTIANIPNTNIQAIRIKEESTTQIQAQPLLPHKESQPLQNVSHSSNTKENPKKRAAPTSTSTPSKGNKKHTEN